MAAMVAVSWYLAAANGGAPVGDMVGHAAAAEWLRTLPWWDWRGWSDWFYGGQAIGVNYPPLGHAWMRFTHPVHGQMAAVALGLLVLLPWGALRLARAVGYTPRAQRVAVASALVLTAASAQMHWVLSGFHQQSTFFGSWPAMMAVVIGLHVSAWAARCHRPVTCGAVAGVAVLFNATVVPGVAIVCALLLATSGVSFGRAARWVATAAAAAVTVSAWWLVPFVSGWARLVRWEVRLSTAWNYGGTWQAAVLAAVAIAAAWAARRRAGPSRRLALAAGAGLSGVVLADLFDYLRPERWLELPIVVAALAVAGLFAAAPRCRSLRPLRPAWTLLGVAFLIVFVVVTLRLELLPLAVWLMWGSRRTWAWSSALSWAAVLMLVPFWSQIRSPAPPEPPPVAPLEAVAVSGGAGAEGLVYADGSYNTAAGDTKHCAWGYPWRTTTETGGRIRPLFGLYRETSATAEFLDAENGLRSGYLGESGRTRPHWFDAWQDAGSPSLDTPSRAQALGARWYAHCDADGSVSVTELSGVVATGVTVALHTDEETWHRAAVEWWVSIDTGPDAAHSKDDRSSSDERPADGGVSLLRPTPGLESIPVLSSLGGGIYPMDQAASGVTMLTGQDSLTVHADTAGWAWLRVPWDPDWRSLGGTPVGKGGPGHLFVWAERGTTEFRWSVPGTVDAAAATVTGVALIAALMLATVNRRRGWNSDPDRPRPVAEALDVFADTVDGWVRATGQRLRRGVTSIKRRIS